MTDEPTYTIEISHKTAEKLFGLFGIVATQNQDDKHLVVGVATVIHEVATKIIGTDDPRAVAGHPLGAMFAAAASACLGAAVESGAIDKDDLDSMTDEAIEKIAKEKAKAGWDG